MNNSSSAWDWGQPQQQTPVVAPLSSQLNFQQHPDMQPAGPAQTDPVTAQLRGMAVNKGVDMGVDGVKAGWTAFNAPLAANPYALAPNATSGVGMVAKPALAVAPGAETYALTNASAPAFGMTAVAPATWAAPAGVMGAETTGSIGALAPLAAATEGLTTGMGIASTGAVGTAGALTGGAGAATSGLGALGAAGSAALASNPVGWGIAGALAANQLLSGKGELGKITHGGK